ncbi:MAG TPA: acetylxylan esterase [Opitutaceae bacterium]|nr:acetylxylan esterase [Opitutaceae bacterium]
MPAWIPRLAPAAAGLLFAAMNALAGDPPASTPITPVPPQAQLRVATVQVRVSPDHGDWTYSLGEPARFRVSIVADNEPVEGVTVSYSAGQEQRPAETRAAAVPPGGLVIDGGTLKEPGFLRCAVTAEVAGRAYRGLATAAYEPEKIRPTQAEPADFDAFWRKQRADLAQVPMEAKLTLLPDQCTDKVNVYQVSFRNVSPDWLETKGRIYGIYCEPKKPGKYPALLRVPGAGVRPYFGDKATADEGAITLEIGIHGIPVNLPLELYDQLQAGALDGYSLFNLDDKETYYYRRVFLGVLRADDFLASRECWDGRRLVVAGASQGGWLTIMAAALDSRVTAIAVTHPAGCDMTGDLHGRAGGWPWPFRQWNYPAPSPNATQAKIDTTAYYDTVNFAKRVKVPGYYSWGYNDEVCGPTSVYAAYNLIRAPKTLGVTLELGHTYTPEQGEATQAFVRKFLGLK